MSHRRFHRWGDREDVTGIAIGAVLLLTLYLVDPANVLAWIALACGVAMLTAYVARRRRRE